MFTFYKEKQIYGMPDGTWNLIDIENQISKVFVDYYWRPDSDTDNLIFVSKDIHHGDKLDKWKTLVTFHSVKAYTTFLITTQPHTSQKLTMLW